MHRWEPAFSALKWAIAFGCITYILVDFFDVLEAFAGKETDVDVSVFMKFVTEFGFYAPWVVAVLSMLLFLSTKRFVRRIDRNQDGMIRSLERSLDPHIDRDDDDDQDDDQTSTDETDQEDET